MKRTRHSVEEKPRVGRKMTMKSFHCEDAADALCMVACIKMTLRLQSEDGWHVVVVSLYSSLSVEEWNGLELKSRCTCTVLPS